MKVPLAQVVIVALWLLVVIAGMVLLAKGQATIAPIVIAPLTVSPLVARISIQPLRLYGGLSPRLRCPAGYELWWPAGAEFENDHYAECVKFPLAHPARLPKLARKIEGR